MGQSTNAVLAYGWAWSEEYSIPYEVTEKIAERLSKIGLEIDDHCMEGCILPALVVSQTRRVARRGYPEQVVLPPVDKDWDSKLLLGLKILNEELEDSPEFVTNPGEPGWMLYSWWS